MLWYTLQRPVWHTKTSVFSCLLNIALWWTVSLPPWSRDQPQLWFSYEFIYSVAFRHEWRLQEFCEVKFVFLLPLWEQTMSRGAEEWDSKESYYSISNSQIWILYRFYLVSPSTVQHFRKYAYSFSESWGGAYFTIFMAYIKLLCKKQSIALHTAKKKNIHPNSYPKIHATLLCSITCFLCAVVGIFAHSSKQYSHLQYSTGCWYSF